MYPNIPVVGFSYRTGVKSIKNVTITESKFPISLITPFKSDRIKPSPKVRNNIGTIRKGMSKIASLGKTP